MDMNLQNIEYKTAFYSVRKSTQMCIIFKR